MPQLRTRSSPNQIDDTRETAALSWAVQRVAAGSIPSGSWVVWAPLHGHQTHSRPDLTAERNPVGLPALLEQ